MERVGLSLVGATGDLTLKLFDSNPVTSEKAIAPEQGKGTKGRVF